MLIISLSGSFVVVEISLSQDEIIKTFILPRIYVIFGLEIAQEIQHCHCNKSEKRAKNVEKH